MKNKTKILQDLTEELLSLMATGAKATVSYDKDNKVFVVNIETENETGLLIGKKGETLSSIQTVLGLLFKGKTGEWNRVVVNVGDYREKEEDYLKNLAMSTAQRAKETGEPQNLYNLKPWQRRIIHLALSENGDVVTESQGEGEERFLVVKPKK
jgi:spoIIIJ-associated protein